MKFNVWSLAKWLYVCDGHVFYHWASDPYNLPDKLPETFTPLKDGWQVVYEVNKQYPSDYRIEKHYCPECIQKMEEAHKYWEKKYE